MDGLTDSAKGEAFEDMKRELRVFENEQRRRLGLEPGPEQWLDVNPQRFTREQRSRTTLLFGGFTSLHDVFIESGLKALGYRAKALPSPDNDALQCGKEFGNRGQCNPAYFTVGNLIRYLKKLRDIEGMSAEEIRETYLFATLGACGPCRFGTYLTEYRKALRDAGFDGFRVLDIRKFGQHKRAPDHTGLALDARFAAVFFKCLMLGDVLNAMGYRTRPYELVAGATDAALEDCKTIVCEALANRRSVVKALRRCRKVFARVAVDWLQPKPKVAIIGEFWAMTTEGEGNYRLQRFLEAEGAECEIQLVTAFVLYEVWILRFDIRERMLLRGSEKEHRESGPSAPVLTLALLRLARWSIRYFFARYARAVGLRGYRLPDMDHLADVGRAWYPNELHGGEGHVEVAEVIESAIRKTANMVVSVKPFGCMPSSGVSDGIQAAVTARYPEANFCAVETSGDGAVSVYSRIQMALFRARAKALDEFEQALAAAGTNVEAANTRVLARRGPWTALHYPRHVAANTAANAVYELAAVSPPVDACHYRELRPAGMLPRNASKNADLVQPVSGGTRPPPAGKQGS
jgi:predicted nucleotide-binding protein (sugar kinase/HSP70/actin superfamily)